MSLLVSSNFPQADKLESVLSAIIAVSNGARTDIEIANQVPGIEGDDRQGRYYRNAAEMLGFIINERNTAILTRQGEELSDNFNLQNPLFIHSVLSLPIYQLLLPYLELHRNGLSRNQIESFLGSMSDPEIGSSMIPRRLSTIIAWLRTIGFIENNEAGNFVIVNNFSNDLPVFEILDHEQPLFGNLSDYENVQQRHSNAQGTVSYNRNQALLDRANEAHGRLVNLVAERIRNVGGVPKANSLIDLATHIEMDYIFEMKSTTASNTRDQIRKGVSQLYEYRYLQNNPEAKLVMVIENQLDTDNYWMLDYLENDRSIHLLWDGNDNLFGSEQTRQALSFLAL